MRAPNSAALLGRWLGRRIELRMTGSKPLPYRQGPKNTDHTCRGYRRFTTCASPLWPNAAITRILGRPTRDRQHDRYQTRFAVEYQRRHRRRARLRKAAAKLDGLTMGAWLSQAIESGDDAPPAADVGAPVALADIEARLDALRRGWSPWRRRFTRSSPNCPDGWRSWKTAGGAEAPRRRHRRKAEHRGPRWVLPRPPYLV